MGFIHLVIVFLTESYLKFYFLATALVFGWKGKDKVFITDDTPANNYLFTQVFFFLIIPQSSGWKDSCSSLCLYYSVCALCCLASNSNVWRQH
jgi:hypothetical protein